MTADSSDAVAFHEAAGGEHLTGKTIEGSTVVIAALPIPDGTVRIMLTAIVPGVGPFGLQVVVPADLAARMGQLITTVAAR